MGETIRAAIWLCDLRGFTSLSEALPRDALIEMLNQYFGPMCDAVEANDGEVLKFIGDAMLAIFPVVDNPATACLHALSAARRARESLAEENRLRAAGGLPLINYGIALHIGDAMYGNIGSETRLDFTVIGPAVNLSARIESLCRDLERSLLISAEFARISGVAADPVGEFVLKGVGAKRVSLLRRRGMFVRGLSVAQLIEQRLGVLQIERVEAFGKPAVTRQGQMVKETECPPTSIGA